MTLAFPTFTAGMVLSMSLIMAIGPQNAHVLRMGVLRADRHDQRHAQHHAGGEGGKGEGHANSGNHNG